MNPDERASVRVRHRVGEERIVLVLILIFFFILFVVPFASVYSVEVCGGVFVCKCVRDCYSVGDWGNANFPIDISRKNASFRVPFVLFGNKLLELWAQ